MKEYGCLSQNMKAKSFKSAESVGVWGIILLNQNLFVPLSCQMCQTVWSVGDQDVNSFLIQEHTASISGNKTVERRHFYTTDFSYIPNCVIAPSGACHIIACSWARCLSVPAISTTRHQRIQSRGQLGMVDATERKCAHSRELHEWPVSTLNPNHLPKTVVVR